MREALFVKQNSEKWKGYEALHTTNPDQLAERFIDITNDLAYAKTFYPKSQTTAYLNGVASLLHQAIYVNKKEKKGRFVTFWKYELPLLFFQYRKQILYSFIIFIISGAIGILSAKYDDRFVRLLMGDSYVNMTNENIAKGDPFGVYKSQSEISMFYYIFTNNARVMIIVVLSGILFAVGPIFFMLREGVRIAAFEYFFFSKGLGAQSILVIWIHGTLEISSLIIAGGAGLILGHGLLFPKTYTRMRAFRRSAIDASKVCLGILPIIFVAAFFESFITRHTGMPIWLSISILLGSAAFIVWYVIIYPILLNKRAQITYNEGKN